MQHKSRIAVKYVNVLDRDLSWESKSDDVFFPRAQSYGVACGTRLGVVRPAPVAVCVRRVA